MASMIEYKRMLAERDLASVWPQWRIVRLLGAGAFGEVYEIQRDEYGRVSRCALKILRRENSGPTSGDIYTNISRGNTAEEFISTVLKEIDIMEKLKGAPNIVVIDDYQVARNSDSCAVLIRMELLKNLGEFMSSRQITIADIIRIGTDVCNALEYCEGQNIIHRDVKESNIFYSDMGIFKLGDFGISRQLTNYLMGNVTMTSAGTVSKMAPEVYRGESYDNRVDIYSLGIVLYSLLNYGRPPFYPPYPQDVTAEAAYEADMIRIKGAAIPPLAGVDSRLNQIVCKACNPKPSGRYRTAAEFRDALLDYYDELNGKEPSRTKGKGLLKKKKKESGYVMPAQDQQTLQMTQQMNQQSNWQMNQQNATMQNMQGMNAGGSDYNGGGGNNKLILGGVLIAAIVLIVGSLVVWGTGRSKPGKKDTNTDSYVAENVTPQAETEAEETGQETEDATEEEKEDDKYLHADWSEDEEEEESYGGGGVSALSARKLQDLIGASGDSEEITREDDGSYSLSDENGNVVANIVAPSWSSSAEESDGTLTFSSDTAYANYSYVSLISPDSYISVLQDALEDGDLSIGTVESQEKGSGSIDGKDAKWFRLKIKDEGVYGVIYWGAVGCTDGSIPVASIRLSADDYPAFSDSDYLADVACITLSE